MIERLERFIRWIMEDIIYRFILWLKVKRKYVIPVDTKKECIIRQNTLVNVIGMAADWICAIIIFLGWSQHVSTYVAMMTIAMYIFADHYKIYTEQYRKMKQEIYICKIRDKQYKYFKCYTPNLLYTIISGILFLVLLFMAIYEKAEFYTVNSEFGYRILTFVILIYMMFIKTKHYIMDTFDLKECVFIKKDDQ